MAYKTVSRTSTTEEKESKDAHHHVLVRAALCSNLCLQFIEVLVRAVWGSFEHGILRLLMTVQLVLDKA